jgi:signal transduction histidine kinase
MWQHTVFVYPMVFAATVSGALGLYSLAAMRRRGPRPVLVTFFFTTVALALWAGFSSVKLLHTNPAVKHLFYRFLYLGASPVGTLALLFALAYTDREEWLRPSVVASLLVVPVAYVTLVFLNPAGVAIEGTRVVQTNGLVVLRVDVGIAHVFAQFFYSVLVATFALGLVVREAVRLGWSYLPQAVLVSVGITAPICFAVFSAVGVPPFDPDGVNLIPSAAAVSAGTLGVATFQYRLLDLPPVAYTTAMEESPDGVFVLDVDGQVVHANARGTALLDGLDAGLGDRFGTICPGVGDVEDDPGSSEKELGTTVCIDVNGSTVVLDVRVRRLERGDRTVGFVVVLRDVTTLEEQTRTIEGQNRRLELLNRVVRHDIRNDMAVVLGWAGALETRLDDEDASAMELDAIVEAGEHVVELTDRMRDLVRATLEDNDRLEPVDLRPALRAELAAVRSMEGVVVDGPTSPPSAVVLADDTLRTVFRNILTNAVRHNDTGTAHIDVTVAETDAEVVIRVADDGPGVPDERKRAVFGRGEKGLESPGSGVGLYLVDSLVDGYGGEVRIEDNDPRGAVFVVRLPTVTTDGSDPGPVDAVGATD